MHKLIKTTLTAITVISLLTLILIRVLILNTAQAGQPERYYQEKWCAEHHGKTEAVLSDKTRVDCVTATHAIEFDFAKKWAESIGQSLGYSIETGKTPGIVLILKTPKDYKYWIKLNSVINHHKIKIDTWTTGEGVSNENLSNQQPITTQPINPANTISPALWPELMQP